MTVHPKILLVVNAEWYFWSHRLSLAKALRDSGCEVSVAAAVERGYQSAIEQAGFRFTPLHLQRRSTNPWRELQSVLELYRLYRRERPDLVHHITIKPVLYGSVAARAAAIPAVINTIPGLGYTFLGAGWRGKAMRWAISQAYHFALLGPHLRVIFQNAEDRAIFWSRRIVAPERTILIRGSGVDLQRFAPAPQPAGVPLILLAARLLWDKGVGEFVEAARYLKARNVECRVVLVGIPDPENPKSIPGSTLEGWHAEGVIEWWGLRDDMPDILKQTSIVVLPSYREGVPRILLEAAAAGLPIIATDVPGCREIVHHDENGLLIPPRDPAALADALQSLLVDPERRAQMGQCGRELVVKEFSDEQVVRETFVVYRDLLKDKWPEQKS